MNLGELKTHFTGLLNRRDCTTTQRDTFLQMAIARAQRVLRVPAMETLVEVTTDDSYDGGVSIPNDLIELIDLIVDNKQLRRVDITTALQAARTLGTPTVYARRGSKFVLGPTPEADTVIGINYYAELDTLTLDADENFLSSVAPDVIVYAALSYAAGFFIDKREKAFEERFTMGVMELHEQRDRDELSGASAMSPCLDFSDDDE